MNLRFERLIVEVMHAKSLSGLNGILTCGLISQLVKALHRYFLLP